MAIGLGLRSRMPIAPSERTFVSFYPNNGIVSAGTHRLTCRDVRFVNIANFAVLISAATKVASRAAARLPTAARSTERDAITRPAESCSRKELPTSLSKIALCITSPGTACGRTRATHLAGIRTRPNTREPILQYRPRRHSGRPCNGHPRPVEHWLAHRLSAWCVDTKVGASR